MTNPDITVYTSLGWGPCQMVKVYLSRKGLSYQEKNVSLDDVARQEVIDLGHRTTPVTTIGSQKVVGYNPPKLDEALAAEGLA